MATRIDHPIILSDTELATVLDALSVARADYAKTSRSKVAAVREYSRRKLEEVASLHDAINYRRYQWK